ncbi:DUF2590 family protein [Desulfoluna butyratoxydans]|uniref:Bacteriophage hp1 orf28 n=1 Tax=Desulfoluna butyratoxydans TaxID=231438 RepID=A0A4U8YGC3_9BACT|nr:DUF2590 family protein [Desulfoluna butyratoxydans]VFQ42386.1 bacteriophage hp1 orf28 [Desulfoluna butyratoxydans]
MTMYLDLLIEDDDLVLDAGGNPVTITDRDVIAQDLVHMIREEGFLPPLVGNRNRGLVDRTKMMITLAVDNDVRIVPGSAAIDEVKPGEFYLRAETMNFGPIGFSLEV